MATIGLVGALGSSLGGCASIHLSDWQSPAAQAAAATTPTEAGAITGSIAPAASLSFAASDRSDWDIILVTVSASLATPSTAHVEWSNPVTGDSGTISDLTATQKPRDCRAFSSTIAGVDGVRLYHAEICRSVVNTWEFSKVAAADGSLAAKAPL